MLSMLIEILNISVHQRLVALYDKQIFSIIILSSFGEVE